MFTVRKVYPGEYTYTTRPWVRVCPAGYAIIDETGKPVIWQNQAGAINIEVYDRKYAATSQANWLAENGIPGTILQWDS